MQKKIDQLIEDHDHNAFILTIVYTIFSVISLGLSTITSLLLGSKSISDIRDTVSLTAFILNLIATTIIAIINGLKLETKIQKHKETSQKLEDLLIDIENNPQQKYHEQYKLITDYAPSLCF